MTGLIVIVLFDIFVGIVAGQMMVTERRRHERNP